MYEILNRGHQPIISINAKFYHNNFEVRHKSKAYSFLSLNVIWLSADRLQNNQVICIFFNKIKKQKRFLKKDERNNRK